MIRTTITTITLIAATTIALATASPVFAAPTDEPAVTTEIIVESADGPCVIETGLGTLPCLDLDWSLGGLSETRTTSDEPTVVGGAISDTTTVGDSFLEDARIRTGRPDDTIDEDAQLIIDVAAAGASILSLDHMMVALAVVFGLIGVMGITTVVLTAFALGRRNR